MACRLAVTMNVHAEKKGKHSLRKQQRTATNVQVKSSTSGRRECIDRTASQDCSQRPHTSSSASTANPRSANTPNDVSKAVQRPVFIPFPEKLHIMLQQAHEERFDHIVSWQPDGKTFKVHQPRQFVASVMPRYFRQNHLRSFQRQLNLYEFTRHRSGPDRGGYFHEFFVRDQMHLCKCIHRVRLKGKSVKSASCSPDSELRSCREEPHLDETRHDDDDHQAMEPETCYYPIQDHVTLESCETPTESRILTLLTSSPHRDIGCLSTLRHLLDEYCNNGHVTGLGVQSGDEMVEFEGQRFHASEAEKDPQDPSQWRQRDDLNPLFASFHDISEYCYNYDYCQGSSLEPDKTLVEPFEFVAEA